MAERSFRTPESLAADAVTRDMLAGFLKSVGFAAVSDRRTRHGSVMSQTLSATSPNGESLVMSVRLCWRFGRGKGDNYYDGPGFPRNFETSPVQYRATLRAPPC